MKSLVLHAPHDIRVEELLPDVTFSPIATMRVISSGICAADSYLWSGDHPWDISYPIVPGHELFGELIAVNDAIKESYPLVQKWRCRFWSPVIRVTCAKKRYSTCVSQNDILEAPLGGHSRT